MPKYLDKDGLEEFFDDIKDLVHGPSYLQVSNWMNAHPDVLSSAIATDVADATDNWIDEHPEVTSLVQDGSISFNKLADATRKGYVRSFETVVDMQAATDLKAGMICHTNGFHTSEDGGAAWYKINQDSSGIDGFTVLSGANGLYCHLLDIASTGYIDIRWTGAYSDYDGSATYTDNAPYFAKAFEYIADNPSTPIKIVGRYGIATQIDAGYALQMFGEYRPSRELIASTDYELKPVSEIFVASGITAFSLEGSGESRTFSFINLDNIKFTSSGRTSTLINAPTFGAPSRPNWIRGCEGSGFANILKSIATSAQFAQGTSFFNFDISDCNFYANSYVIYTDSINSQQLTIGNLSINNSVLEQGGGQLYINNSFGTISITNALIEGNTGTMHLHGSAPRVIIMGCYFEANHLAVNITGLSETYSSVILASNTYVSEDITITINSAEAFLLDIIQSGVTIYARRYRNMLERTSSNTIATTTTFDVYRWRENPNIITTLSGSQEVIGPVSTNTRKGLYHNTYANNASMGVGAKTSEAGGYVVFSFYAFTQVTLGLYDLNDSGIYTGLVVPAGLNVIVFKTTNAIRPRPRITGEISNILISYISESDAANYRPIDFAMCANRA